MTQTNRKNLYQKNDLLNDLARLINLEKFGRNLDLSLALAREIVQNIGTNGELSTLVPEAVWHFLSDVDIRFRENEYAKLQLEALEKDIAQGLYLDAIESDGDAGDDQ